MPRQGRKTALSDKDLENSFNDQMTGPASTVDRREGWSGTATWCYSNDSFVLFHPENVPRTQELNPPPPSPLPRALASRQGPIRWRPQWVDSST